MISPVTSIVVETPRISDGVACHRIAAASQVLDVNSRYAYLLWCRDFAATSVVARRRGAGGEEAVGFVTGYRRPDRPDVLVVWQVAVDDAARGMGLAGRMLDAVFAPLRAELGDAAVLETTITPDNTASIALFTAFAARHDMPVHRSELFGSALLGDGHEPEILFRIGPRRIDTDDEG